MKLLGARVAIRRKELTETESGIILTNKQKQNFGEVIAVGPGVRTEEGIVIPVDVEVGDTVIIADFTGVPVEVDGEEIFVINERDILAKL